MSGIVALLLAAQGGFVDHGWQPIAGGGIEYIIRLDPAAIEDLGKGNDVFSDLPPATKDVRTLRITAVSGPLPNQGKPLPAQENPGAPSPSVNALDPQDMPGPGAEFDEFEDEPSAAVDPPARDGPARVESRRASAELAGDDEQAPPKKSKNGMIPVPPRKHRVHSPLPANEGPELPGATVVDEVDPPPANRPDESPTATPPAETAVAEEDASPSDFKPSAEQSAAATDEGLPKPWLPLAASIVVLGVSLGANLYLAWMLAGVRRQFRVAARRVPQTLPDEEADAMFAQVEERLARSTERGRTAARL